jgi:hypothetical protein
MASNPKVRNRWLVIPKRSKGIFVWDNRKSTFVGYHIHHGAVGAGILAWGIYRRNPLLVVLGSFLMLDDRDDFPWVPRDVHSSPMETMEANGVRS